MRRRTRTRREQWTRQWRAIDECGAVSIFAGVGLLGEAGWGGGSEVKSLIRQGIGFDGRSPET